MKGYKTPAQSVLVVDDSPLSAALMQALLTGAGLRIIVAGDAEKALEILANSTPDLILMDMQLPGLSGLELTRMLKADPSKSGIAIFAVTANDSAMDRQLATDAGCEGFIAKPIDTARFANRIRLFLASAQHALPGLSETTGGRDEETFLLRKTFLSDGARDCGLLVGAVEAGATDADFIDNVLHRWVGCGEAAGLPEVGTRAARMREMLSSGVPDISALTDEARALRRLFDDEFAACGS